MKRLRLRRLALVWAAGVAGAAGAAGIAWGGQDAVIVYPGFGDARGAVVEGRVVEARGGRAAETGDGSLRNLWRNARAFSNDERKSVPVWLRLGQREWQGSTDREGYFRFELGAPVLPPPGWHELSARSAKGAGAGALLLPPPENRRGIISDLDDTIVITEVTSKLRMLRNTFLSNPAQRRAVGGMAQLYRQTLAANPRPEAAPLIYLSASPRQLHESIARFLEINGFPRGVLITKRVTDDRSSEPLLDQYAYKMRRIEDIFARWPQVRFILVGDDGERDPEIYDALRTRHPDRIEAIWIRQVNPKPHRPRYPGQRDLSEVLRESAGTERKD